MVQGLLYYSVLLSTLLFETSSLLFCFPIVSFVALNISEKMVIAKGH